MHEYVSTVDPMYKWYILCAVAGLYLGLYATTSVEPPTGVRIGVYHVDDVKIHGLSTSVDETFLGFRLTSFHSDGWLEYEVLAAKVVIRSGFATLEDVTIRKFDTKGVVVLTKGSRGVADISNGVLGDVRITEGAYCWIRSANVLPRQVP